MSDATTEVWTYAGRREFKGGSIGHAWEDATGSMRYFKKPVARVHAIGGLYEVDVVRKDDTLSVVGDGRYVGKVKDRDDDVLAWRATDVGIVADRERQRAAKKAGEDTELSAAIDVLRRHYSAGRGWHVKAGFIAFVTAEITAPN